MSPKRVLFYLALSCTALAQSAIPTQEVNAVGNELARLSAAPAHRLPPQGAEATERARLSTLPPLQLQAQNVPLRSLVKYLAEQAQMAYIALPTGESGDAPVTLNAFKNPYEVLDMLRENYGLGMEFKKGVWHFYQKNIHELVARNYQLQFNTTEEFESSSGGGNSSQTSQGQQQSGSTSSSGMNLNSAGSSGTGGLNGSQSGASALRFKSDQAKRLVTAIEKFLKVGTTQSYATFLQDGSVGDFFRIPEPDIASTQLATSKPSAESNVTFNSDNNTLYILATRQQHEFIEGLIESFDRPQRLIAIETKFIETARDTSRNLGLDWSKMTGNIGASLTGLSTDVDLGNISATQWPNQAILSANDFAITLRAIAGDSSSTAVQYPRVVTVNNRQVSLRSVVQRPVLKATTSTSGSGLTGSQTTQSVENVDIGTVVDILPKILADSSGSGQDILLNIVMSVSNVTGTVTLLGQPYPVTSNRLYNYQVIVTSGNTLAIGGLEAVVDTTSISKVPGFGDIPFFGFPFKSSNPSRSSNSLMMFVTPTILRGYAGGLSNKPIAVTPLVGASKRKPITGEPAETVHDVRRALAGFGDEVARITQLAQERRASSEELRTIRLLDNELDLMDLKLREELAANRQIDDIASLRDSIAAYRSSLKASSRNVRKSLGLALN